LSEHITSDEPYLLVEEVAERLGLPLSVLLHRVEAGDIPARRVERADGLHYALRLGDLGIELDDHGLRSAAIEEDAAQPETTSAGDHGGTAAEPTVESAIFSAFDSGPARAPGAWSGLDSADEEDDGNPAGGWDEASLTPEKPWQPAAEPPPPWALRAREPQQPPVWLNPEPDPVGEQGGVGETDDALPEVRAQAAETFAEAEVEIEVVEAAEGEEVDDADDADDADEYLAAAFVRPAEEEAPPDSLPPLTPSIAPDLPAELPDDEDTAVAELAVPPPGREPVSLVDAAASGPRGDLASMSLDARELVAGLLDRWERTLEQRIYTEQRQRFQAELVARQNMVKQLQMELHTARAEHAAAQAEKDRVLAGKERELADRERDLADTRRAAEEAERLAAPAASRRRRWFWNRDD
jgi:hypothetical protein